MITVDLDSVCSFCKKTQLWVMRGDSGKGICNTCAYFAKLRLVGHVPGTILCHSCDSVDSFYVFYDNKTMASFVSCGLDKSGVRIYIPQWSSGAFTKQSTVVRITCGSCESRLPVWLAKTSVYL